MDRHTFEIKWETILDTKVLSLYVCVCFLSEGSEMADGYERSREG